MTEPAPTVADLARQHGRTRSKQHNGRRVAYWHQGVQGGQVWVARFRTAPHTYWVTSHRRLRVALREVCAEIDRRARAEKHSIPLDSSHVLATLLRFRSGALPAAEAMRRLGLDWRGDLLRYLVAYGLTPPLGGHAASAETLALVDDLLDPLLAYSEGRLDRAEAIRRLGLRDYAELLVALGDRGLPMPMPPPDVVEAQARIVEQLMRDDPPNKAKTDEP